MIKPLENKIIGTGEVKDFIFTKITSTQYAYLYEVDGGDTNVHYEVFERKTAPTCIDFEKRIYSDVDVKEYYPKSKDFGLWAWTFKEYSKALYKLNTIKIKDNEEK